MHFDLAVRNEQEGSLIHRYPRKYPYLLIYVPLRQKVAETNY